ncbi:MAG TPA: hypothetical protein VEA18_02755 [Candidatus Kapabacteria bacterium]|nr:hypothetical protein [Candidatus Kapabacteria bacterium]
MKFVIFILGMLGIIVENSKRFSRKSWAKIIGIILIFFSLFFGLLKDWLSDIDTNALKSALSRTTENLEKTTQVLNDHNTALIHANETLQDTLIILNKTTSTLFETEKLLKITRQNLSDTYAILQKTRQYSYVANYGVYGGEYLFGPGLETDDKLYNIMKETYFLKDEKYYFKCGEPFELKYMEAINENPDFPFSYFALANCKYNRKDSDWRAYAQKAINILRVTTQIGGHNKSQKDALSILENNLK